MGGAPTFRLEPPRLRTDGEADEERHATWFELYFDLVFVAAVGELATGLARDPSAATFGRFAGLFIVVGWAWAGFIFYANRFDTDDLIYRLAKSGAMLATAALAIHIPLLMRGDGGTVGFAIAYVVVRSLLVALYVRARMHVTGRGRDLINIYIVGFSFTTALWLVSIFVPEPYRFVLWGVALVTDLSTPTRAWPTLGHVSVVVSHLTERYGTFFIIVLAEAVVGDVAGVAGFDLSTQSWIAGSVCFLIALSLWWIYFDLADTSVVGRGRLGLVYVYGHFPLFAGVAAFGAGTRLAIVEAAQPGLGPGVRWALAGGIAAFALALALLHLGAEWTTPRDPTFIGRLLLAAASIALAALGGAIAPVAFTVLVAVAVLAQLLVEAFTFPEGAASVWEPPGPAEGEAEGTPDAAVGAPLGG